jgi:hypothetical protein
MFIPPAAAGTLNQEPNAQHGDRIVEDEDGDGQVTLRFYDNSSSDPDSVFNNDVYCDLDDETTSTENLERYWWDTSDEENFEKSKETYLGKGDPSPKNEFDVGIHRIGLEVEDNCGATDWTNFTLEVNHELIEVYRFDDSLSLGDEWSTNSLWGVTEECETGDGARQPYLAYTVVDDLTSECDFETGDAPSGSATLAKDLSHSASSDEKSWNRIGIEFRHWWDTAEPRSLEDQDMMVFQVSFDGGETWQLGDHTQQGCGDVENEGGTFCWDDDSPESGEWQRVQKTFDLRTEDYDGGEILFRWHFDALSGADNDGEGWFVDDVEITGIEENDPPVINDVWTDSCNTNADRDGPSESDWNCDFKSDAEDPDGSSLSYSWDFGSQGTASGSGPNPTFDWTRSDETIRPDLTVHDAAMAYAEDLSATQVDWEYRPGDSHSSYDDDGLADESYQVCGDEPWAEDEYYILTDDDLCDWQQGDRANATSDTFDTSSYGPDGGWEIKFLFYEGNDNEEVVLEVSSDGGDTWVGEEYGVDGTWEGESIRDDDPPETFESITFRVGLDAQGQDQADQVAYLDDYVFVGWEG